LNPVLAPCFHFLEARLMGGMQFVGMAQPFGTRRRHAAATCLAERAVSRTSPEVIEGKLATSPITSTREA
jgi:hypothetical protein